MTIEEFERRLKALLQEAEKSGLDAKELCQAAEWIIISEGWKEEE